MRVMVSIHDVSPAFRDEVENALALCHERGLRPALLVVPNFHHRWPLTDYPEFVATVADLQRDGHPLFLHGHYHLSDPKPASMRTWYEQRVVSGGEAEFGGLSAVEVAERLQLGESMLAACELPFTGFVPPAWVAPPALLAELQRRGIAYTETHQRIHDLTQNVSAPSLALNFASRTPGRLLTSVVGCRVGSWVSQLASFIPVRVAIHPKDMRYALLRHEIERLLDWAAPYAVTEPHELFEKTQA